MNYQIEQAISKIDEVKVSRFEYPAGDKNILDKAGCCFLAAFIRSTKAKKILEFGSGFSSLVIARELENKKEAFLYSVDSSKKFSNTGKDLVSSSCSGVHCEFFIAKVKPQIYNKRLLIGYSINKKKLEANGKFDLVSIDVPAYNRCICESATYEAFSLLREGGFIVIGNANSAKPYDKKWKKLFGKNAVFHYLDGLGDGIMVIEKIKNSKPKWLGLISSAQESCQTIKYAYKFWQGKLK